ncbi:GBS Bsp-like repeat protein [Streptococcus troglodytae]|uniref:GBS Bsp-like repeat protein n=2 Tax=Streptococcus troglodytae TaxID=1111760 RepID=A0A1L7LJN1_9STRE|nr:GBS Bsp-like repeat protein [Streptococcus troglodytae]
MEEKDIILTGFYNVKLNSAQEARLTYNLPNDQTVKFGYDGNDYSYGSAFWYIYNRTAQLGKEISSHLGENAGKWREEAVQKGYTTGNQAKVGAIACLPSRLSDAESSSHLAFVEYLNSDGSFIVSEMPSPNILNWRLIQPQSKMTFIYL